MAAPVTLRRDVLMMGLRNKKGLLKFRNAIRLKMAEYWLALGKTEEALQELARIPLNERKHPEFERVRERLARPSH